ncbi:YidC/Oxa1 family membrane protein insertase [Haloechinothrix alba]|uniref:Membrane protein insertase YidC n=1 Tax=Haloechinothrix alba TaxID=664784 RepID=A0A238V160_9PSEU|nr:YidC/Oxa1 family membrane protein insertase [Haloechinothrix alba]
MLDFIYYPVSFILWFWHKAFGFVLGETQAVSWVLGIVFLTFTVRAILFKPFVSQVRSMRKMQDFAPEIKKIQKRYANDRQRQAQEMQKLQREHGVNPVGGCLPILLQIPVFIGLVHVLRLFASSNEEGSGNYFFSPEGVSQYIEADIFGSNLGQAIYNTQMATVGTGAEAVNAGFHSAALPVGVPMMILASILTHLTARHSVQRQNPATATQQTAIMNKLTQYMFPIGLLVFGAFMPLGLLIYFLANNTWTLMQQRLVYRWIDREEEQKKEQASQKRTDLAPKPGQRPDKKKGTAGEASEDGDSESDDGVHESQGEADGTQETTEQQAPQKQAPQKQAPKKAGTSGAKQNRSGSGQGNKQRNQSGKQPGKQAKSSTGKQGASGSGKTSGGSSAGGAKASKGGAPSTNGKAKSSGSKTGSSGTGQSASGAKSTGGQAKKNGANASGTGRAGTGAAKKKSGRKRG